MSTQYIESVIYNTGTRLSFNLASVDSVKSLHISA